MQGLAEYSDYELVKKTCEGVNEAFAELVYRYQKPLLALCMKYADDVWQAEDIVQDSFLKAFEKLSTFEFRSAFKSWMYRIAINTAKNRLRGKKKTVEISQVVLEIQPKSESSMVEEELKYILRQMIEDLPGKQKSALQLRVYNELSFHEVAEQMGCAYDTAKANYRHGLTKLRELMEEKVS